MKFQVLTNSEDFVSTRHGSFDDLSSYCFDFDSWERIFEHTAQKGLDIILMPLNTEATGLAKNTAVKFLDIHSVSFNDTNLLKAIRETNKNIILGIGGRTQDEIDNLISFFRKKISVLMVGFQSFPSKLEDIGLGKIQTLKAQYPKMEIGYADHSEYNTDYAVRSNEYARILGATVFEKHATTREGNEKIDSVSAVSIDTLKDIISRLHFIENYILSNPNKEGFNDAELKYRNRQAIVVANRDLQKDTILSHSDLALKLFDGKADYNKIEELIGQKLVNGVDKDYPVLKEDVV